MKAIGVLIIALGLIMIVIGVQGTQGQVLQTLRGINPVLRKQTGTGTGTTNSQPPSTAAQSGGGNPKVTLA